MLCQLNLHCWALALIVCFQQLTGACSLNVLVVYAEDGTKTISSLAEAVAFGASSAGATTKTLAAVAANYKR